MSSVSTPLKEKVAKFLAEPKKLYINGDFVLSVAEKTFQTLNPATGEVLATVYEGQKEDIDLAVRAARAAFDQGPWKKMTPSQRSRLMYKLADLMEENKEELAQLETLDNGKP
ncbi:MAG TPA: betaine-aldehyde dehydrogenase, partial [Paenibacillaceae bacterium]|nr:betaine-aldehyde dehydrogenase [Paenibacillaceae bacterium]